MPVCPECSSQKTWKKGFRHVQDKKIQRYLCRICGHRFSEKTDLSRIQQTSARQICVLDEKAKNLVRAKQKNEALKESKPHLVNFSWYLQKEGYSEATIKTYTNYVKNMGKLGELNDPEEIKGVIATHYIDKNSQRMACCSYDNYLKFKGGIWKKPRYKPEHKQVFIPTDEELRIAVNTGYKENFVFVKFLYETGARSNEAQRLEWTDLDPERRNVKIKASKNGNSRTLEISRELMDLLFSLPKDPNKKTVFFKKSYNSRSSAFNNRMKRLAKIHNNRRFKNIHFHTFRHCKALREYHKTRDILYVMGVLGHRKLNTTYIYVSLYHQIYKPQQPNQFLTKIASTKKERIDLINDGWSLVEKEGDDWYFRKPK